jgi:hypothetical protein
MIPAATTQTEAPINNEAQPRRRRGTVGAIALSAGLVAGGAVALNAGMEAATPDSRQPISPNTQVMVTPDHMVATLPDNPSDLKVLIDAHLQGEPQVTATTQTPAER